MNLQPAVERSNRRRRQFPIACGADKGSEKRRKNAGNLNWGAQRWRISGKTVFVTRFILEMKAPIALLDNAPALGYFGYCANNKHNKEAVTDFDRRLRRSSLFKDRRAGGRHRGLAASPRGRWSRGRCRAPALPRHQARKG